MKLDRLGDFVLALGAIRQLIGHFGPTACRLVVSEDAAPPAEREFPAIERLVLPAFARQLRDLVPIRRRWRQALGRLACDELVCLRHQGSAYRDLILNWLPAKRRHVLHGPFGERSVIPIKHEVPGPIYPDLGTPDHCRELVAHRVLVSAVMGRHCEARAITPTLAATGNPGATTGKGGRRIVIAPFAGATIRDLPGPLLSSLIEALGSAGDLEFILTGTTSQSGRLQALAGDWASRIARVTVAAEPPLSDLIDLLASADLVISADSAPAHLATALDRPLIAVLGGGHYGLFGPWQRSAKQAWLHHELPCYGCDWTCIFPEPKCITELPADRVIDFALESLRIRA